MRMVRAGIELVRLALSRETLEEPPFPSPPPSGPRHRVLHLLFVSREPLGEEPVPPPREGKHLLRWIFGREALPEDPVAPRPAHRSRLAALFAPEKLEDDSP
jgi:hypothetical protein